MDYKETTKDTNENSNSKSCDSSKVILNSNFNNELLSDVKVSNYPCYVCANDNPQFVNVLSDGRLVSYCGDCFVISKEAREILS